MTVTGDDGLEARIAGLQSRVGKVVLAAFIAAGCQAGASTTTQAEHSNLPTPNELAATQVEMGDFLERCLAQYGFDVVRDGPAVGVRVEPEQESHYQTALEACTEEMNSVFPDPPMLSGEAFYKALVEARSCLVNLGFPLPAPPSLETFLESLDRGEPPWSPHVQLPERVVGSEWERVNLACPQPAGA